MSKAELEELAALHALGLLEGEELRLFERELETNPLAKEAASQFGEAADLMIHTVDLIQPPARLEETIFSNLPTQNSTVKSRVLDAPKPNETVVGFGSWIPWSAAAALAIVCAVLWSDRVKKGQTINEQNEKLAIQSELLESRTQEIYALQQENALGNLRIAVLRSKLENAPDAEAIAVWDGARQQGRLSVSNLPAVPAGKEYQLWLIDSEQGAPVSAGVFNTDEQGVSQYVFAGEANMNQINAFALSVENEGGSESPQGPIVLITE